MAGTLKPDVADKLLDKLATDDNFRDLFSKNPEAALKQVGHTGAAACMRCKKLAGKDAIAKSRDALRTMLTSTTMAQQPVQLDVG
jgi:putative modified peptide